MHNEAGGDVQMFASNEWANTAPLFSHYRIKGLKINL